MTRMLFGLMLLMATGCAEQAASARKESQEANPDSAKVVTPATTDTATESKILNIGSKAPPLKVSRFLKGEPVKSLEPGQTYVVEFWATWCGPCIQSMPHITELQKKFPEVTFIGVNVMERQDDAADRFLEKNGEMIGYRIARDEIPEGETGNEGLMNVTWLQAAGVNGIPTAFVVNKEGVIANITHPMTLDESLPQILDGSWNIAEAAKTRYEEMRAQIEEREMSEKLQPLLKEGVTAETLDLIESMKKEYPTQAENLAYLKFQIMSQSPEKVEEAVEEGRRLLKGPHGKNMAFCNEIAWRTVSPERKTEPSEALKKLALDAALQADSLAQKKHPLVADTLARAQFLVGDQAAAIETQKRAIRLAKGAGADQETMQELKDRLKQYEGDGSADAVKTDSKKGATDSPKADGDDALKLPLPEGDAPAKPEKSEAEKSATEKKPEDAESDK